MAQRLIKEKDVLRTIKDWWACAMMAEGKPTLCDEIRELPSAEAIPIERIRKLKYDIGLDKNYTFHGCINKRRVYELIDNMIKEYSE